MEADLGIVLRGVGGIYDVQDNTGKIIRCYPRGRIKQQDLVILAGDKVRYTIINGNEGVIEAVLPRSTVLPRPAVANIEQLIVVSACASPKPQPVFIDRLLILAESRGIHPLICLNKIDLLSESVPEELSAIYDKVGYQVLKCSAKTGAGLEELRECLQGKISSFAGPSGVGKSSLLNALEPDLRLMTGMVSKKTGRGRQTTRQVELLPLTSGGLVADTPGFSQLRLEGIESIELDGFFPEFAEKRQYCRFSSCLHRGEPGCAIKAAVEEGEISSSRYSSYKVFLEELEEARNRY